MNRKFLLAIPTAVLIAMASAAPAAGPAPDGALLFQQRALPRGQFDCRQRAAAWAGLAIGLSGAAGLLL